MWYDDISTTAMCHHLFFNLIEDFQVFSNSYKVTTFNIHAIFYQEQLTLSAPSGLLLLLPAERQAPWGVAETF